MAADEDQNDGAGAGGGDAGGEASHGPQECMPCRGTGRVISNLGGKASKVACPWCQGQGTRQYGIDAQQRWLEEQGKAQAGGG